MKKHLHLTIACLAIIVFTTSSFFTTRHPTYSGVPPAGSTGATGSYCTACHGGAALNSGGGSVQVSGLPTNILSGTAYNFSLTTTHGASNRLKWGFSISAKNSAGQNIGTFSTTNPNAALNTGDPNELSHNNAVTTGATNNYTYNNLTWTAPSVLGPNDGQVTFYYVGNAANGTGSSAGDFIYAGTLTGAVVLPVSLSSFEVQEVKKNVVLKWRTESEMNTNYFSVQRSSNGVDFKETGKVTAAGISNIAKDYTFADNSANNMTGTLYYRLVTVDTDGSKQTSTIKKITLTGNDMFVSNVYPTLAKPGTVVSFNIQSAKNQTASIAITLADGKVLENKIITVGTGTSVYKTILPATASAGIVYLSVFMDGKRQQIPISVY